MNTYTYRNSNGSGEPATLTLPEGIEPPATIKTETVVADGAYPVLLTLDG